MKEVQDLLRNTVSEYEFQPLHSSSGKSDGTISEFDFQPLSKNQVMDIQEHEKVIKIERTNADRSHFKISPVVREHRGINRQEELERQRLIQEEVERQLVKVQQTAYQEGLEKGMQDGREEVFGQLRAEVDAKVEQLQEMINVTLQSQAELLQNEKMAVYRTIKNLTKWIILRELKDDGEYVLRLLEKLISELQVKSNILVQIDPKSFSEMPDVLDLLKERMESIDKVRVECDYDIEGPGIVLESDNGIINGSLKEQFRSLAKLFENVGLNDDEGFSAQDFYETPSINEELKSSDGDTNSEDNDPQGEGHES